jgi:hypothetical protein
MKKEKELNEEDLKNIGKIRKRADSDAREVIDIKEKVFFCNFFVLIIIYKLV